MPSGFYKRTEYHGRRISEGCKRLKQSEEHKRKRGLYQRGIKATRWDGGIKKTGGYIFIYTADHPYAVKRYVKRAHLIIEQMLGRYLTPKEVIHHKGTKYPMSSTKNRSDDRPENLKLYPNQSKHISFHNKLRKH